MEYGDEQKKAVWILKQMGGQKRQILILFKIGFFSFNNLLHFLLFFFFVNSLGDIVPSELIYYINFHLFFNFDFTFILKLYTSPKASQAMMIKDIPRSFIGIYTKEYQPE